MEALVTNLTSEKNEKIVCEANKGESYIKTMKLLRVLVKNHRASVLMSNIKCDLLLSGLKVT